MKSGTRFIIVVVPMVALIGGLIFALLNYGPSASASSSRLAPIETGGISGHVFQADGVTPVPGAWVYAMDDQFDHVTGSNAQTDGSYTISGLASGRYYLAVNPEGFGGVLGVGHHPQP
jgi:hypothetical protein